MKLIKYTGILVATSFVFGGCQQTSSQSPAEVLSVEIFVDASAKQKEQLKDSLEHYALPFVAQPCEIEVYPSVSVHLAQEKEQVITFPQKSLDEYRAQTEKFGASNIVDMERVIGGDFKALNFEIPKSPIRISQSAIHDIFGQKSTETGEYLRSYVLRGALSSTGYLNKNSFKELVKQEDISAETVYQVDSSATKEHIQDTLSQIVCGKINKETKRLNQTEIIVLDTKVLVDDVVAPPNPPAQPTPKPVVPAQPTPKPVVPAQPTPKPVVPAQPTPKPVVPAQPTPKPVVPAQPAPKPVVPAQPAPKPVVGRDTIPKSPPGKDVDLSSQNCGEMLIELKESLEYSGDGLLGRTKPWTIAGHAKTPCLNDPLFSKYVELCYRANASMKNNSNEKSSLNCN